MPTATWKFRLPLVVASAVAALVVRLAFLHVVDVPLESDEAIVGLMAHHILYHGEVPTYYYGQHYLGPLEAASAALFIAVLGPTVGALRLAPIVYSVGFVALTVAFADRAFGRVAAVLTAFYLALPPLFLLTWDEKARGGYAELLGLGAAMLWLALDLVEEPRGRDWRWLLLGALAGLGLWTDPLAVVYVGPAGLYLALSYRQRLARWTTLAALATAVLGCLPMILDNLKTGGATIRDLAGTNASQPLTAEAFVHNLEAVARTSLPVLLGFAQASSNQIGFEALVHAHLSIFRFAEILGIAVLLAIAGLGLRSLRAIVRLDPGPADLLAWTSVLSIVLFASSQIEALHVTEPRYLLPLYSAVPLASALAQRLGKRHLVVVPVAVVVSLLVSARGWIEYEPSLAAPVLSGQVVRADDPGLARLLVERGDRALYADYWIVYATSFTSEENVVGGVIDDQLRVGFNRYIPDAIVADQSPDPAVVVVAGSPAEQNLRAWLTSHAARYQETRSADLVIIDHLDPAFRPVTGSK